MQFYQTKQRENFMKKLLLMIALTLCAIIGISVITLAFVKTDYNQISVSNIDSIEVFHEGKKNEFYANGETSKDIYNTLRNKYINGSKEVILSSLFQGAYSSDAKAEIVKASTSFSTESAKSYLIFEYTVPQTVKLNDKVYEDETKITEDKTVKYQAVTIEIINSKTLTEITAKFRDIDNINTSTYQVKFIAKHADLYNYITELKEDSLLF
jgi:hypothetical protein